MKGLTGTSKILIKREVIITKAKLQKNRKATRGWQMWGSCFKRSSYPALKFLVSFNTLDYKLHQHIYQKKLHVSKRKCTNRYEQAEIKIILEENITMKEIELKVKGKIQGVKWPGLSETHTFKMLDIPRNKLMALWTWFSPYPELYSFASYSI